MKAKRGDKVVRRSDFEDDDSVRDAKRRMIINLVDSSGLKRRDDDEGSCKVIRFKNCSIHFFYQGYKFSINDQEYDAYFSVHCDDNVVEVYWRISDLILLVNCTTSLKAFLNSSCLLIRSGFYMKNKTEFIDELIDNIFIKQIAYDLCP